MKKLLVLLLLVLCFACNGGVKPNEYEVISTAVDMSGYEGVNSVNHNFKETTVSEITRALNEEGSGVFYVGYTNCSHCQKSVRYLNEVAQELGVIVYYVNAKNPDHPIQGESYEELFNDLYDILNEDEDGKKAIFTPHVFSIINGKIVGSKISDAGGDDENSIKQLKNEYLKILEPFKK